MLAELSTAIDYTDFMLGENSNQKAYLYLLTAEILVKQGMIYEGIKIYKQLLDHYMPVVSKQEIYLSVSRNLLAKSHADPNELIDFIQELMGQREQKSVGAISEIKNERQAQFYKHLANLYKCSKNHEKAAECYELLMKYHKESKESEVHKLTFILKIGDELMKCYKVAQARIELFHTMFKDTTHALLKMDVENQFSDLITVQEPIINFYTNYFCEVVELNSTTEDKEKIRTFLN